MTIFFALLHYRTLCPLSSESLSKGFSLSSIFSYFRRDQRTRVNESNDPSVNSLLLLTLLRDSGYFFLAQNVLSERVSDPPIAADHNTMIAKSVIQAYNSSRAANSVDAIGQTSASPANVPSPLPSPFQSNDFVNSKNYQDIMSGFCAIDDYYCSFEGNGGVGNSSTKAFNDQCLL